MLWFNDIYNKKHNKQYIRSYNRKFLGKCGRKAALHCKKYDQIQAGGKENESNQN